MRPPRLHSLGTNEGKNDEVMGILFLLDMSCTGALDNPVELYGYTNNTCDIVKPTVL